MTSIIDKSKHWNLRISRYAPEYPRDPPEPLICSDYERCKRCTYMAHGFQCDHRDGKCVLTENRENKED